jgi:hypothetical protein
MELNTLLEWLLPLLSLALGLPTLGMAVEDEDIDDDPDDDPKDPGKPDDEPTAPKQPEEPFFRLNDRTVYKTADELKTAHSQANERLEAYRKYGSPEEIAALRERASEADRLRKAFGGGGEEKPKEPYSDLPPEDRDKWNRSAGMTEQYFKHKGYLTREQAEELADRRAAATYDDRRMRERSAEYAKEVIGRVGELVPDLKESDPDSVIRAVAAAVEGSSDRELAELWRKGDHETFVRKALGTVYPSSLIERALQPKKEQTAEQPADPAERNGRGQFVSRRERRYAAAKDSTRQLPKPGQRAGAAGAPGADKDETRNLHRKPGSVGRILRSYVGLDE